jgi:thioredoxin reductase (NADPH)
MNKMRKEKKILDIIIVGAGPAGLASAIYSARYGLDIMIISKEAGGLASTAHKICNYPGFNEISGFELMNKFLEQVRNLNVPLVYEEVLKIEKNKDKLFVIETYENKYFSRKVIFAGGMTRKKLGVKGEDEFYGKGVSYCATCDAGFFKNKKVAIIGGSDAALTSAILLSEYASEVYIIYRKDKFYRAEKAWIQIVEQNPRIKSIFNEEVLEIIGDENNKKVKKLLLKNSGEFDIDGVFIEIGSEPNLNVIQFLNVEEEDGFIKTNKQQQTNIPGFYAAGDITNCNLKQIVTAASQGAISAFSCFEELKKEGIKK